MLLPTGDVAARPTPAVPPLRLVMQWMRARTGHRLVQRRQQEGNQNHYYPHHHEKSYKGKTVWRRNAAVVQGCALFVWRRITFSPDPTLSSW